MDPDILTVDQACALLDVSEPVLRAAMRRQRLPYRRIGFRVLRFSRAALLAWIAAGDADEDLAEDETDRAHPGTDRAQSRAQTRAHDAFPPSALGLRQTAPKRGS